MASFFAANKKLWVILFLVLHGLIVILWLGMMFSPQWVKMDTGDADYDFEGSLNKVTYSDSSVLKGEEDYAHIADYYCDWEERLAEADSLHDVISAACTIFTFLSFCCCLFWLFEVFAGLYHLGTLLVLGLMFTSMQCPWVLFITTTGATLWHFVGIMTYNAANQLVFSGECDEYNRDSDRGDLCAMAGAELGIAIFVFLVVFSVGNCVVVFLFYKQRRLYNTVESPDLA